MMIVMIIRLSRKSEVRVQIGWLFEITCITKPNHPTKNKYQANLMSLVCIYV